MVAGIPKMIYLFILRASLTIPTDSFVAIFFATNYWKSLLKYFLHYSVNKI